MLLEFGLRNFFSFKEGATVSFELDANCPETISQGLPYSTVLCVKGANASGKTSVLRAISFLAYFCTKSFNKDPDSKIPVSPFFHSKDPSEFFVRFLVGDIQYEYELSLTDDGVVSEVLSRTKAKKVKLLERKKNELVSRTNEFKRFDNMALRSNVSIFSMAHQYGLSEGNDIYSFFNSIFSNVTYTGLSDHMKIESVSKRLADPKSKKEFEFLKGFIKACDVGIDNIEIAKMPDKDGEGEKYFPIFIHGKDKKTGKEQVVVDLVESSGTKALFRGLLLYYYVLEYGGVLVLDEFDIYLHPHILPKLIKLFLDPSTNKGNAQLIFSTHNAEIMDLLGRYRTYLVNKEDNESYAYRLDELPSHTLRNDRPISPAYNDRKIGGIPKL